MTERFATPPIESETDEILLALCAIRYTLGRQSYIVDDGVRWARHYGAKYRAVRRSVIRDIEDAIAQNEHQSSTWNALGGEMDERAWRAVLAYLQGLDETPAEHRQTTVVTGCCDCPCFHSEVGNGAWCAIDSGNHPHPKVRDRLNPNLPLRPDWCPLTGAPVTLALSENVEGQPHGATTIQEPRCARTES